MSNLTNTPNLPSEEFLAVFRDHAGATGTLRFDQFMELALYHPGVGYYRRERPRVGYGKGTDFFTASTSGALFGELVCAASCSLLGHDEQPADYTFVEIGAEPDGGVLTGVSHDFAAARTIRVNEPIALTGKCVVFSNELFDAQPFRRFIYHTGAWHEVGVQLRDGKLSEASVANQSQPPILPASAPEGYRLDLPLASVALAERIAAQSWTGLFVAFDYGKSWREFMEAAPAGTARAYFRHTQSNDLIARPGEQDLTCHVCWDWLLDALSRNRFNAPRVVSQESFLIRHAAEHMAATAAAEATRFSQRKLGLLQLLHHLGQKFQVLWGTRR
jgi:SAM-dependent MidA family methyltransferase